MAGRIGTALLVLGLVTSGSVGAAPSPPSAPQNLQATPGDGQATFTWVAPLSTGGAPILAYNLTCTPAGATAPFPDLTATSLVFSPLPNGVEQTCTVNAVNSAGAGPSSNTVMVTPGMVTMTVSRDGTGTGTVVSSPAGIDCGATCSGQFVIRNALTLTATPSAGSDFSAWTGCDSAVGAVCTVAPNGDQAVTATFTQLVTYNIVLEGWQEAPWVVTPATGTGTAVYNDFTKKLAINLTYSGLTGTETSAHLYWSALRRQAGVDLATLSAGSPKSDIVTLDPGQEAQLSQGYLYVNIHTSTKPNGEIRGQIDNVGAVGTHTLTVATAGTGTGTVNGYSETGQVINCGSDCSEIIPNGVNATLFAATALGHTFTGWSGDCTGTGQCDLTMNAAKNVTATFSPMTRVITVNKLGSGSGTVTSSPPDINCGATCNSPFNYGTSVTLTATPDSGSHFVGWTGLCSGTGGCTLTADADKSVTARFDADSTAQSADVQISQSASPDPAGAGKDVIFTLTVQNQGPAAATGVVVTNPVPVGATFVWAKPPCAHAAGTVTCNVGSLAVAASTTLKIVLRKTAAGSFLNPATVTATQSDPVSLNNSFTGSVTVNATPPGVAVQRYRLYSDVTKEHHFTTDLNEYNVLGTYVGTWVQEGGVGKVLDNPGTFGGVDAVPYYRLYDNNTRWHHWTTDANEYYTLGFVYSGWSMEGVDGYILPSNAPGSTQLYRLNYPALGALHHWTIDANEYNTLILPAYGWVGEGGSGFVIQ